MVERVITNPDEGTPTDDEANLTDDKSVAAQKAAEEGGVVVNGTPVEKADEGGTPEVTPRPDNVPEKFWDAEKGEINTEALLKSQSELEKKLGAPKDEPNDEGEQTETPDAEAAVLAAEEEYAEAGELSDATYEALEKAGYGKAMVDRYIAGQMALAEEVNRKAYAAAGDKETYDAMIEWAAENLEREAIDAFNLQVTNPETMEYAIQQMHQKYQAEADVEPDLLGGENGAGASGDYFKNSKEMQAAINSPEYKTDPNVQAEVQRKIALAEAKGVRLFG